MNKQIFLKLIKFFILYGIILTSLFQCFGDNDDGGNRSQSSEPSRAISPQREYTRESPAEWEGVANDHLPEIVFDAKKSKDNIKVKVLGKKFSERHYIEVIGIMDERSVDIDLKYFKRGEQPVAILSLNLKDYEPEKIKVFAKCNLHDLWTVPLISVQ